MICEDLAQDLVHAEAGGLNSDLSLVACRGLTRSMA